MCSSRLLALGLWLIAASASAAPAWEALGKPLAADEIASWDIDVRPDGVGLPPGHGSVDEGQVVYDTHCASCHGTFGESTDYLALAGGVGSLGTATPQRTVGSKLDYATTLWDYINRAMPFNRSKALSVNEVYAVTAYVLNLNDILPADAVLDEHSLPQIEMPNRKGFTQAHGMMRADGKPDVRNTACMKDCLKTPPQVSSALPAGFTHQLYGELGPHFRQFMVAAPAAAAPTPAALAASNGCLACHAAQQTRVGPAFADVARRYAAVADAPAQLRQKVRAGGSGVWGSALMPPQTTVTDAALDQILGWILAGAAAP